MDIPIWAWLVVVGVIIVMLLIDLIAHRDAHEIKLGEALRWSIVWILSGITFGVIIWMLFGSEFGEQYFAGFLIEKSLAVDNVFVWALIFASLGIPAKYQHRILFFGVVGALVFRGIFIAAGAVLLKEFSWILYLFAALLIYTGIHMLRHRNSHSDPRDGRLYRWTTRVLPSTDKFYGQRFLVRAGATGAIVATPLLIALILVELTDIVFAVDSIPAIFGVTQEAFLVFTANAFAILGLRAMYFLLADLVHRFVYLKLGLAAILIWVGAKMALHDFVKVDTALSLIVIASILLVAIGASLWKTRGQGRRGADDADAQHYEEASPTELAEARSLISRKALT